MTCAVQTAPRNTPVVAWLVSVRTGRFCGLCDGYGVGVAVGIGVGVGTGVGVGGGVCIPGGAGVGFYLRYPPLRAAVGVGAVVGFEFGMLPPAAGSAPPAAPPPPPPHAASVEIAKKAAIDEKAKVLLRPVTGTESPSPQTNRSAD